MQAVSGPTSPAQEAAAKSAMRALVPRFLFDGVLVGLLIFVISAAAVVVIYQNETATRLNQALENLRPQGQYLASLVDPRAHAWLVEPNQTGSQPHTILTQRLQTLRQFYPDIGKLFTGRLQNGKIFIIIETQDSSSTTRPSVARPLGFDLPADSPEIQAIQSRQTYVTDDPAFRQDGSRYLGVIVPLNSPTAGGRDFLYLDTKYDPFMAGLASTKTTRDVALVAAALFGLIAGWTVFRWRYASHFRQSLAQTKVREGEELFRSTYAMSPVPMYLTRTDGQIIQANKAFCEFLGYAQADVLKLQPAAYTHAEDLNKELPLLQNLKQHQTAKFQTERRYIRHDRSIVWGLVSVAIVRDSDANISHYMTQVVDITERKRAEETVRLSEERLALAADAGHVGMWDCDMTSGRVVWNDVMHEIYHTDFKTFEPTLDGQHEVVCEEDREAVLKEFRRCQALSIPYLQEFRITTPKGVRHVKASAQFIRDQSGHGKRAVGTTIDITEEKEESEELIRTREAALAADKAKSEFLAVMSHEIRTPLNGVLGFVSMLKNTPLDAEQMSYIDTMENSGQGLLALVNDILDLSKIESREIHVDATNFEVRPFVRKIHQQLQARAYEKKLHYDFFVEYSVPKTMHSDPIRLGQILTNILGNAVKFTDYGRIELHVSAKPLGLYQKNWEWIFSVKDTGPGIPKEAIPNLFKLFYQVDSSATRRHGGTGLGLAISHRIATLLNGEIKVESEPGEGTLFTITITAPRGQQAAPVPIITPPNPLEPPAKVQGKRILVVEDNPVNRKLCALQLKRLGCMADFAETGLEAIDKVRENSFDAVLMDMQLPDLDGCGATREIRREERAGERLSIIALTANAMPEDRKRCLDAGMDDFLSKPLQYETLAATLSKWV